MKVIPLSDVKSDDHASKRLAGLTASLEIETPQSVARGGISLALEFQYEGPGDVAIHNPIHFIQYTLKGRDGLRMFNGGQAPIPLINRKRPIDPTADFNFAIEDARKNGRALNVMEHVNAPSVRFHRGDRLSYRLKISQYADPDTRRARQLPEGAYHMELIVSLIQVDSTTDSASSRTLKAQDVDIVLAR